MRNDLLASALAQFYDRAQWRPELAGYLAEHHIDLERVLGNIGAIGLLDVVEYPDDRFDFGGPGRRILCLTFEALDADEQPLDLVALPVGEPERPMTLLGLVGFLRPDLVKWPGSYGLAGSMRVHRHARDWLEAGCTGTAIIRPEIAAREMLDAAGKLEACDWQHARELKRIAESVVDRTRVVVADPERVAA